jgi:hypothetical protein
MINSWAYIFSFYVLGNVFPRSPYIKYICLSSGSDEIKIETLTQLQIFKSTIAKRDDLTKDCIHLDCVFLTQSATKKTG